MPANLTRSHRSQHPVALLVLILCGTLTMTAGGVSHAAPPGQPIPLSQKVAPGNPAADRKAEVTLDLLNYDAIQKRIASHKGKIVVVDVWTTACPPCVREFPGLVKLNQKYSRDDVICISLSLDYLGIKKSPPESYREPVLAFLRKQQATFENVLATESVDEMLDKLELGAPPAVYVYDRAGKLVKRFDNEHATSEKDEFTYEHVGQLVAKLVADKK